MDTLGQPQGPRDYDDVHGGFGFGDRNEGGVPITSSLGRMIKVFVSTARLSQVRILLSNISSW